MPEFDAQAPDGLAREFLAEAAAALDALLGAVPTWCIVSDDGEVESVDLRTRDKAERDAAEWSRTDLAAYRPAAVIVVEATS